MDPLIKRLMRSVRCQALRSKPSGNMGTMSQWVGGVLQTKFFSEKAIFFVAHASISGFSSCAEVREDWSVGPASGWMGHLYIYIYVQATWAYSWHSVVNRSLTEVAISFPAAIGEGFDAEAGYSTRSTVSIEHGLRLGGFANNEFGEGPQTCRHR